MSVDGLSDKVGASKLPELVRNALMTSLMPDREKQIVETCMSDCGILDQSNDDLHDESNLSVLDESLIAECRRTPSHPLLVPNPRFEDNPGHTKILNGLLEAHSVGERALLIMGYQGVGKNRVVDSLLHRLRARTRISSIASRYDRSVSLVITIGRRWSSYIQ